MDKEVTPAVVLVQRARVGQPTWWPHIPADRQYFVKTNFGLQFIYFPWSLNRRIALLSSCCGQAIMGYSGMAEPPAKPTHSICSQCRNEAKRLFQEWLGSYPVLSADDVSSVEFFTGLFLDPLDAVIVGESLSNFLLALSEGNPGPEYLWRLRLKFASKVTKDISLY